MIISHKYQFIFIKNMKVAGTSLEVELSPLMGQEDVLTPISPPVAGHEARNDAGFKNHMTGAAIREKIDPQIWNSYYKFCIERNPWEKALSHYWMRKARRKSDMTFDEYLAGAEGGVFPINYQRYTEPDDPTVVIVDEVLLYENLEPSLDSVFSRLGVPFEGLKVRAKVNYRPDRRPYQEVYTPRQASVVANMFAPEIAMHGYRFD